MIGFKDYSDDVDGFKVSSDPCPLSSWLVALVCWKIMDFRILYLLIAKVVNWATKIIQLTEVLNLLLLNPVYHQ